MTAGAPHSIVFAIAGPLSRDDLPKLCESICRLLDASGAELALCDLRAAHSDAVTIDALARLQLGARRRGCRIQLLYPPTELVELLALTGLCEALAT